MMHTRFTGLLKKLVIITVFSFYPLHSAWAEIAVIVNPGSGVQQLTEKEAQKLFLGKQKKLPGGQKALPVYQKDGSEIRNRFNEKLLGKSATQLKSYWSKLIFSGKGKPPKNLDDDESVKGFVAKNEGAIGYIDASSVDGSVNVVLSVP